MHYAIRLRKLKIVEFLLENGANVNAMTLKTKETPLFGALHDYDTNYNIIQLLYKLIIKIQKHWHINKWEFKELKMTRRNLIW